ncbi:MAG: hypothetical protein HC831_01850 [Chloroflexia bacterium]|nr:hypothetical protein [Chloroflexia bacterium]
MAIYQENQQKAMLTLRDKISEELKPLVIHIKNNEYYELFEFMREVYNKEMRNKLCLSKNLHNKFLADKKIIDAMDFAFENKPESFESLNSEASLYQQELKKLNIKHWVVDKNNSLATLMLKSLGLILTFPIFLYGFFNNFIPYYLPRPLTRKLKDRQFTSSINFVFGLIFYPVFYLIQFSFVWIFTEIWWIKFLYLVSLPISGILAFKTHRFFIKIKAQWKFYFAKSKKQIIDKKNCIYSKMKAIVENQSF